MDVVDTIEEMYAVSIKEASRLTNWHERWIRENLKPIIIHGEGQVDTIRLVDLKAEQDKRKGGRL